jgi:Zn-dependent protease with chaperone function
VFANFAARRHLTGPLRAVSPVAESDSEIDWKTASKKAKKAISKKPVPATSVNSQKLSAYFKKSFKGSLAPDKNTFKDNLELGFVEVVSLFIPLLYISVVLGFTTFGIMSFSEPMFIHVVEARYLEATYWASPAVLMFGFLYILMRPLFGGFKSYHGRVLLNHEAPALFALTESLSRHLNVRAPKRIEINNETVLRVDAYAGINSIYRDEYKIVIGAPLLMGLSLNQLTAMLAHELSHFRNKQKKVAFYLMHHVSEWLYFRASGQDKFHQKLLQRMQKEGLSKFEYVELWVWQRVHLVQQSAFYCLFSVHRRLTAWKSRKIEMQTDEAAIAIVGTAGFISMLHQLRQIQNSQVVVSGQNDWAWKEGYLLDDYALAVALEASKATAKSDLVFKQNQDKEVTRFCPCDAARITHAKEFGIKGVLTANISASLLLENPNKVSKELTLLDYLSSGIVEAEKRCVSSGKIRQLQAKKVQLDKLAYRYFDGRIETRILRFEPTEERDISQFDIQTSIDYIRRYRVEDRKYQISSSNLLKRIHKAYLIQRLTLSGLPVKKHLGNEALPKGKSDAYLDHMRSQYQQALYHMEAMDQVFYQRAFVVLNYLDVAARSMVLTAFSNLEYYAQVRREVLSIEEAYNPLSLIVNSLHNGVSTKILQAGVKEKQQLWLKLKLLIKQLEDKPVKVSLNRSNIHIIVYLEIKLGKLPDSSSTMTVEDLAMYVSQLLQLLSFQYHKWQSQVALVMSRFEVENGVSPVNLLNKTH